MNGYTDGCRDGLNEIEAKILKYITESIRTDG